MNEYLLVTRPNHDVTTNYLCYWNEDVIKQAAKSKIKAIDLKGKRANKSEFSTVVRKVNPVLVVFNGHGNSKTILGFDNQILIQVGENEKLLERRIIYALACSSAKKLGPKAVAAGATTYIGYTEDFVFLVNETKVTRPHQDKTAQLFLEPSNQVSLSLIKGYTASESCRRSKGFFRKNIQKLMTSEASLAEKEALPYLFWDMQHQVCLGDQEAKLR